jgi:hypothetical protein
MLIREKGTPLGLDDVFREPYESQSLRADQGEGDHLYSPVTMPLAMTSQSLRADQGEGDDLKRDNVLADHLGSQSLRADQGEGDTARFSVHANNDDGSRNPSVLIREKGTVPSRSPMDRVP